MNLLNIKLRLILLFFTWLFCVCIHTLIILYQTWVLDMWSLRMKKQENYFLYYSAIFLISFVLILIPVTLYCIIVYYYGL